jgi:hypothetical protein
VKRSLFRTLSAALAASAAVFLLLVPAAAADGSRQVIGSATVRSTVKTFLVPTLPRPFRVRELPCPGDPAAQGCHSSSKQMDTIWLNPGAGGLDSETLAHEMGHVFESYMWDLHWNKVPGSAFVPKTFTRIAGTLFEDPRPGIVYSTAWTERFAESYSACARFPALAETLSTGYWGFTMTPAQHARICPMIGRMADRYEEVTADDPSILSSVALPQAPSP